LHLYLPFVNVAWFIATKVARSSSKTFSRVIIRIAVGTVALSVAVMLLTTALIRGFKQQISEKIFGFWGHIHITSADVGRSIVETRPISINQDFYPYIDTIGRLQFVQPHRIFGYKLPIQWPQYTRGGVSHIQAFALKPGIIKVKDQIEGIILKGIGRDFDWSFLEQYLVRGRPLELADEQPTREVLISQQTADRLQIDTADQFVVHFVEHNQQIRRRFKVVGIYKTGLEEYDKRFALVDIRVIQQLMGWDSTQVAGFEIFLDDIRDLTLFADYIYYEILPNNLWAETIREKFPEIFEWLELQDINEVVIIALMLIVSVLNMVTMLLILILERTNMIGILKALGYTNWGVRRIFLYYAAWIIGNGLLWGNVIGLGLGWLQQRYAFIRLSEADYYLKAAPVSFDLWSILLINVGSLIVILLFLLLPSWLVARIHPVKAIRFN